MMTTDQLHQFVLSKLDDMKAKDILSLAVSELTDMTDYMIIASGTSNRHVRSIADNLTQKAKEAEITIVGVEGEDTGEWVLVDFSDVVVHIMQEETRRFYDLEKLWAPMQTVE